MDNTSFLYVATRIYENGTDTIHIAETNPHVGMILVCDECKKTFYGKEVILKPFGTNFTIVTPLCGSVKLVQDKTTIIGIGNTANLPEDHEYYTMHCPHCGLVHLFGFDVKKE